MPTQTSDIPYQRALRSDPLFWEHAGVVNEARRARLDLMSRPGVFRLPMAQGYAAYLQRFGTDGPYRVAESQVCEHCLRDAVTDQRQRLCWRCPTEVPERCAPSVHARFMEFALLDPDKGANCPLCSEYLPAPGRGKPHDLRSWGASPKPRVTVDFDQDRYIAHTYYADVIMPDRDRRSAAELDRHLDRDRWVLREVKQDLAFTYVLGFENWLNDVALDPIPSHRRSAESDDATGLVPSGQATIAAVVAAMGHRPRRSGVEARGRAVGERGYPWEGGGVDMRGRIAGVRRG